MGGWCIEQMGRKGGKHFGEQSKEGINRLLKFEKVFKVSRRVDDMIGHLAKGTVREGKSINICRQIGLTLELGDTSGN